MQRNHVPPVPPGRPPLAAVAPSPHLYQSLHPRSERPYGADPGPCHIFKTVPPSTHQVCPVTQLASSDNRNRQVLTMSSVVPMRRKGKLDNSACRRSGGTL